MMVTASHLEFAPTFVRALSLGCAAFLLAAVVRTAWSWRSRHDAARPQVGYMLTGVTLLVTGIVINHFVFIVRDEAFHWGTTLMIPGYLLVGVGVLNLNRLLPDDREPADVARPDKHQ